MAGNPIDVKVAIVGVRDVQRALRNIDPELAKQLRKELREAGKLVAMSAKKKVPGRSPLSGWRNVWAMNGRVRGGQGWPAWYTSEVKQAIKVSTAASDRDRRTKTRTTVSAYTQNPAGAIYEFAKTNHTPNQFSSKLGSYMGGRIMWAGYDSVANEVRHKIDTALDDGVKVVQSAVDVAKV